MKFSGSYDSSDVTFCIDPLLANASDDAEALLRAHAPHPVSGYDQLFLAACLRNGQLVAGDVVRIARGLAQRPGEIVIVSLMCAGTPLAILVHRALKMLGRASVHYSVSTVRGRGLDRRGLDYILARHQPHSLVFFDGWTGKGSISAELRHSAHGYLTLAGSRLKVQLAVLSDLAGAADLAGSSADYLIPSAMHRAVVNGLVTNSQAAAEEADFDRCFYLPELAEHDLSRWFVDRLSVFVKQAMARDCGQPVSMLSRQSHQLQSNRFVWSCEQRYRARSSQAVMPGVNEATRALLTRTTPMILLLKCRDAADTLHLSLLAEAAGHETIIDSLLPYQAAVILRS